MTSNIEGLGGREEESGRMFSTIFNMQIYVFPFSSRLLIVNWLISYNYHGRVVCEEGCGEECVEGRCPAYKKQHRRKHKCVFVGEMASQLIKASRSWDGDKIRDKEDI